MAFHNPYHFVPVKPTPRRDDLPVDDFEKGKVGHVTHDRFVQRTGEKEQSQSVYSGRLVCRLTAEDPIVIGDRREPLCDGSHRVFPFELDGKPAIPATTLRGLLSSIAEAASNSALRVLEDRPFSYRAAMEDSLPALGMIVEDPQTKQRKLRPLALPPLWWDDHNKCAEIPMEYRGMFTESRFKVYVNGYRKKPGTQPPTLELVSNSFLQRANPDSFSADRQEFWYLKLAGSCTSQGNSVAVAVPHLSRGWVLGQKAAANEEPIAEVEYHKLSPNEQRHYTRGILRILGIEGRTKDIPTTKTHEIFLPYPPEMETAPAFDVEEALKEFHALAAERTTVDEQFPFHLKGSQRNADRNSESHEVKLRPGDLVFFKPDSTNKVREIAISSIWRRRAGGGSHDYFKKISRELLPFHKDREQLTIAEQLFGFVEQGQKGGDSPPVRALAGRLRFSFGLLHSADNDQSKDDPYEPEVLLKVLDSPKPPSPALYFKYAKGENAYIAKKNLNPKDHVPQGRKFYLHRYTPIEKPWESVARQDNLKQKSRVRSLRSQLESQRAFYFHIDFDNLSQRELELLCYAVRPTDSFRHKLGMGKPLGLGKVRIDPVGLFYINRQARYEESLLFVADRYHGNWLPTGEDRQQWPSRYEREKQETGQNDPRFPSFDTLRESFRNGMDSDIRQALELLGDPRQVRRPVHTPQVVGGDMEQETYRWFVANDLRVAEAERKFLEPLNESSTRIEFLQEHPWNE